MIEKASINSEPYTLNNHFDTIDIDSQRDIKRLGRVVVDYNPVNDPVSHKLLFTYKGDVMHKAFLRGKTLIRLKSLLFDSIVTDFQPSIEKEKLHISYKGKKLRDGK